MKNLPKLGFYLAGVHLALALFVIIKGQAFDGMSGDDLARAVASTVFLNIFPLLLGQIAKKNGGKLKQSLRGSGVVVYAWFTEIGLLGMFSNFTIQPMTYLPAALFSAVAAFIVFYTSAPAVPAEEDNRVSIKFSQADSEGRIRETEVLVTPKKEVPKTRRFSKDADGKSEKLELVNALITSVYSEKKARFMASGPTPGEAEIVCRGLDKEKNESLLRVKKFNVFTLAMILRNYTSDSESLKALHHLLDTTQHTDETAFREMAAFNSSSMDKSYYAVKPHLNNLRKCHPILAREDLSELEGDDLEFAKQLLDMSIDNHEDANDREGSGWKSNDEFRHERSQARRTIRDCTPYMTPALADVVLNHPDKLELVEETLTERGIPVHQADALISEIVNASVPLSEGAL